MPQNLVYLYDNKPKHLSQARGEGRQGRHVYGSRDHISAKWLAEMGSFSKKPLQTKINDFQDLFYRQK